MPSTPIIKKPVKLHKQGGGFAIYIPKVWFESNGIDPEKTETLLLSADRHVVVYNPKDVEREYRKHSNEIQKKIKEVENDR